MFYRARPLETEESWQTRFSALPQQHVTGDAQESSDARASFAARALAQYAAITGGGDDVETTVCDLLGDLRHLCDAVDADFDYASDRSEYHYNAEIRGEL